MEGISYARSKTCSPAEDCAKIHNTDRNSYRRFHKEVKENAKFSIYQDWGSNFVKVTNYSYSFSLKK